MGIAWLYEPPETTGAEDAADAAGACDGVCSELPEPELLADPLELLLEAGADWLAVFPVATVWPWKDLAAATEITPVAATAPAIIQRLTREISANPASLADVALGLMAMMMGPG